MSLLMKTASVNQNTCVCSITITLNFFFVMFSMLPKNKMVSQRHVEWRTLEED